MRKQRKSGKVTLEMQGCLLTGWRSPCDSACLSIVLLKNKSSSLWSSIQLPIHPSVHSPHLQYIPVVCRKTLLSVIHTEEKKNKKLSVINAFIQIPNTVFHNPDQLIIKGHSVESIFQPLIPVFW